MLSVQHGRSNPYVRGPVLLLCLHGKSVKLCTNISLGEGQLCRGGQSVCRDTAWVTVGQRPIRERLLTCWMTQTAARSQKIQIWMLSYISSAKFFWQLEAKKTQVVRCHCICERVTKAVISPDKRVAARGKCPLFKFFGLHKHLWKKLHQAPPGLEVLSLGCFEPSAWRLRSVALMAVCVMEIGLELSKLTLLVPSCGAPLWPTLFSAEKALLRQLTRPAPPQWKKLLRVSFWILTGTQEDNS